MCIYPTTKQSIKQIIYNYGPFSRDVMKNAPAILEASKVWSAHYHYLSYYISYYISYRLPKIIQNQGEKTLKSSEERRRLWISWIRQNFEGKNLNNIKVWSFCVR